MPRPHIIAQRNRLAGDHQTYKVCHVRRPSGVWVNLSALYGTDFLVSAEGEDDANNGTNTATVTLARALHVAGGPPSPGSQEAAVAPGTYVNLAPLDAGSPANAAGGNYSPLIGPARQITLDYAMVAPGQALAPADFVRVFSGYVEGYSVSDDDNRLTLSCVSVGKFLAEADLRVGGIYGTEAGTPLGVVLQQIIDAAVGPGVVTLYALADPNYLVTPREVEPGKVLQILRDKAREWIGWDVRDVWVTDTLQSPCLVAPTETKTVPDLAFSGDEYLEIPRDEQNDRTVRNVVDLTYADDTPGPQQGQSVTVRLTDPDSIREYGERYMALGGDELRAVRDLATAERVAQAAVRTLSRPPATGELRTFYVPWAEVADLYEIGPQHAPGQPARLWDAPQRRYVVTHRWRWPAPGEGNDESVFALRGAPRANYVDWLNQDRALASLTPAGVARKQLDARPVVDVDRTSYESTREIFTVSAALGADGIGPLQWRERLEGHGNRWTAWRALPSGGGALTVGRTSRGERVDVEVLDVGRAAVAGATWTVEAATPYMNMLTRQMKRSVRMEDGGFTFTSTTPDGNTAGAAGTDAGGRALTRSLAKPTSAHADTLDGVSDGATFGRPTYTRLAYSDRAGAALNTNNLLVTGTTTAAAIGHRPAGRILADAAGAECTLNPDFARGLVGWQVYDNAGGGARISLAIVSAASVRNGSGKALQVTVGAGTQQHVQVAPGWGGFYCAIMPDGGVHRPGTYHVGAEIEWTIIAAIPAGYALAFASNAYGDGGTFEWTSTTAGTGDWATYTARQTIGTGGTFSSTGFFYLAGGPAVLSAALIWQVARCSAVDVNQPGIAYLGAVARGEGGAVLRNADVVTADPGAADVYGRALGRHFAKPAAASPDTLDGLAFGATYGLPTYPQLGYADRAGGYIGADGKYYGDQVGTIAGTGATTVRNQAAAAVQRDASGRIFASDFVLT